MAHSREWILKRRSRRLSRNQRFGDKAAFHGINWDWYHHETLYDFAMSADPAAMRQQARDWTALGRAIGQTTDEVRMIVGQLLETWRGSSASQAAASNENLTRWAQGASETATRIGAGLDEYAEAAAFAKANMPPPESGGQLKGHIADGATHPNSSVMFLSAVNDQKVDDDRKRAAKAEAVRVMKHYGTESQNVHDTMPWFYDAPPTESGPAPVTAVGPPYPSPPPDPDPKPGVPGTPVGPLPGGRDAPSDGTTPEGFTSVEPGLGAGDGSRGGPGSGYGAGLAAGPGSGGADVTRGVAGPGGLSGAGGLAARGGAAGGMGGVRGAAGAGGGFGAPFGAGAGGAQREEDKEHKNKFDEGLDLFDDLPPAYPPVFGA